MLLLKKMNFTAFLQWKISQQYDQNREAVCIVQLEQDGSEAKPFYAKFYDQTKQPRGLINEVFGCCIAKSWGFDVPEYAAIAFLPIRKLNWHACPENARWLKVNRTKHEVYPAFCTSVVNASPPAMTFGLDLDSIRKDVALWKKLPAAVALDHVIANTDRHFGNLLRLSKARYALIDHGRLFNEQSANWFKDDLQSDGGYKNRLAELMIGTVANFSSMVIQEATENAHYSLEGLDLIPEWINKFASQNDVQHIKNIIKARALNSPIALPLEMGNLC